MGATALCSSASPGSRKGYLPLQLARPVEEAQRHGLPIKEEIVAWGERERA